MERKVFQTKALNEKGHGSAVIATLNVIDKDNDVTLPGAFGEQPAVVIPVHDWDHIPIGKTVIKEVDNEVIADFKLNMDSTAGREWHSALKFDLDNGVPLQEWSYGFNILDHGFGSFIDKQVRFLKKLKVHEISPVLLGAGQGTRTVSIKGLDGSRESIRSHETAVNAGAWDIAANETNVKSGEPVAYYRNVYAWQDADGDTAIKSTYKFIHHLVSETGEPKEASIKACQDGIDALNGFGTTVPDADRVGVYRHLAKHLKDAGIEAVELKGVNSGLKLADHIETLVFSARNLLERVKSISDMRIKEGRKLSVEKVKALTTAQIELQSITKAIDGLVYDNTASDELVRLEAQFEFIRSNIKN